MILCVGVSGGVSDTEILCVCVSGGVFVGVGSGGGASVCEGVCCVHSQGQSSQVSQQSGLRSGASQYFPSHMGYGDVQLELKDIVGVGKIDWEAVGESVGVGSVEGDGTGEEVAVGEDVSVEESVWLAEAEGVGFGEGEAVVLLVDAV